MSFSNIILVITVVLTALQAGLFYAWSCTVMLGFARLENREFVSAMQQTNRAIQNPIFFASFFGAPIFLVISTFLHFGQSPRFGLLLASAIFFIIGTFGVTVFGNVPLNNEIGRFKLESASDEETLQQRLNFESRWNNLNTIRTISSIIAVIILTLACLNQ